MMRAHRWIIGALLAVWLWAPVGWSDQSPPSASAGQDRVEAVMGRAGLPPALEKLGRGLSNVAGGWLEIPLNIGTRYAPDNTAASLFTGTIYGILKGIVRTGVGAYETLTFFLPIPEDFAPILPILPYFQRTTKRQPLLLE